MKRTHSINKGFTLIELLVVIAIVGVLIALLAPAIASTREKSQIAACMNNMKQISMAAFMYADDHNSVIPDVSDTATYTQETENVYRCPRDTRQGVGIDKPSYTAYQYTPASLLPSSVNGLFSEAVLYLESDEAGIKDKSEITKNDVAYRHDNRTVVVFADGHIFSCNNQQIGAILLTGSKGIE
ncbi:MAG: type II secretion system GspH family protein [Candidatus Omnitrophica bacterium]|nr:type II secretion system GspH family protein [Candidatus Omnitrophota bacterium]MBU4487923.1 type II secretion system GspH family protein [Candidatus Omnitrophota bacterium]MCG2705630.1 type II secretion system GspH family protein [Candidatus Omnitrophota bacterium]